VRGGRDRRFLPAHEPEVGRDAGKQEVAVTIALHSGEVVSGVIGSSYRFEYTVVADTVNAIPMSGVLAAFVASR